MLGSTLSNENRLVCKTKFPSVPPVYKSVFVSAYHMNRTTFNG